MPIRRKQFRRKPRKKRAFASRPTQQIAKRPRMAPRVLQFKRKWVTDLTLNSTSPPAGWTSLVAGGENAISLAYVLSMAEIPNYANFTNLFDSYKLTGVRLQGYLSFTTASPENQSQSIIYMCRDHLGQNPATVLTEEWFNERPRSRKRVLCNSTGRPSFDIYMPLSQLNNVYQSVTNNDYTLARPRFISTNEVNTPHYGLNLMIKRLDNQPWTANTSNQYPTLKVFTTVYFQCRGINS